MTPDRPVAIVTGGTAGIGEAVARRLADDGYTVVILGRSAEKGAAAVERLRGQGDRAVTFYSLDVADAGACADVVDTVGADIGPVGVLVNNAGTWVPRPVLEVDLDSFDRTFAVNVKGSFFMTQATIPLMMARGRGAVVNIASIAGRQGFASNTVYCATKGALISMTAAMAVELAPMGIRVNAVAPGNVETEFNAHLMSDQSFREGLIARTPAGRNGTPEDVAGAVAFLVSDDASWVHGETFTVDGGWMVG